jgi:ABC-type lipoprotein release transport system permease subunit
MNKDLVKLSLFLSWRSLWRNKRRTIITITAIVFGTVLNVILISFAEGMYFRAIEDTVQAQAGHIVFEHPEYRIAASNDLIIDNADLLADAVKSIEGVREIKPLVKGSGLLRSSHNGSGVSVFGVVPPYEAENGKIANKIMEGHYLSSDEKKSVVISDKLAKRLKVKVKKRVVLVSSDIEGETSEAMFRVLGIFKASPDNADANIIHITLKEAQEFFGMSENQLTRLGILLENPDDRDRIYPEFKNITGFNQAALLKWEEVLPEFASYIKTDRFMNFIICGMFMFLILFTIFNTIMMSVLERKKEFAITLSLGTPPGLLKLQILLEGIIISFVGCFIGMALGYLCYIPLREYGVDMQGLFPEGINTTGVSIDTHVYSRLTLNMAIKLFLSILGVTSAMAIWPMLQSTSVSLTKRD